MIDVYGGDMEGCKNNIREEIRNVLDRPTSDGSAEILMNREVMAEEVGADTLVNSSLLSRREGLCPEPPERS